MICRSPIRVSALAGAAREVAGHSARRLRSRTLAFAAFTAILLLGIIVNAGEIHGAQVVALTGQQAPGLPAGQTFTGFSKSVLGPGSAVSFQATAGSATGVWGGAAPATIDLLALEGTQAPDLPAGYFITSLYPSHTNALGQTLIEGAVESVNGNVVVDTAQVVFIGRSASDLHLLAGSTYGQPNGANWTAGQSLTDGGLAAIVASFPVDGSPSGLYAGTSAADLNPIVAPGTVLPGATVQMIRWGGVVGDSGHAVVIAGNAQQTGIWTGTPGNWANVMLTGRPGPGNLGALQSVWYPGFDRSSTRFVTFAQFTGGASAVMSGSSAHDLKVVAQNGDPAPGVPGAVFGIFGMPNEDSFPVVNSSGRVAFRAGISNSVEGIWTGSSQADLVPLALDGAAAPGTPPGTVYSLRWGYFTGGDNPLIDAAGDVVFAADLQYPDVTFGRGLFFYDPVLGTRSLVQPGDLLELSPGVFKTVGGVSLEDFNDQGVVLFYAGFTDGTSGLMTITVPEPMTGGLLVVIGTLLTARRHRSRIP